MQKIYRRIFQKVWKAFISMHYVNPLRKISFLYSMRSKKNSGILFPV